MTWFTMEIRKNGEMWICYEGFKRFIFWVTRNHFNLKEVDGDHLAVMYEVILGEKMVDVALSMTEEFCNGSYLENLKMFQEWVEHTDDWLIKRPQQQEIIDTCVEINAYEFLEWSEKFKLKSRKEPDIGKWEWHHFAYRCATLFKKLIKYKMFIVRITRVNDCLIKLQSGKFSALIPVTDRSMGNFILAYIREK